jgi:dCMP deaminase
MNMKPVSSNQSINRPDWCEYYITIAMAVRDRANCQGSKIGAILVLDNRILTTGYNGTPQGMPNCDQGGCDRCLDRQTYSSGEAYDLCICVHAEQNTLLSAARFGISVEGADLYTTLQPCFGCTKELLQAKVNAVYYMHDWQPPSSSLSSALKKLHSYFLGGMTKIEVDDPKQEWARSNS